MTIIKTFDQPEKESHSKRYIGLCLMGITCLVVLQVWANNTMAIYGDKFAHISELQQSLSLENQLLEAKIDQIASLNNVASKSAILGLVKPKDIEYIP